MDIEKLIANVKFGQAMPAYKSKSLPPEEFQQLLQEFKTELESVRATALQNLSSMENNFLTAKTTSAAGGLDLFGSSSLFSSSSSKSSNFSLLDDILNSMITQTRLAAQQAEQGENSLESQVSDRYKMDYSRMTSLFKQLF